MADEEPNLDPGPVQICYPVYLDIDVGDVWTIDLQVDGCLNGASSPT